MSSKKPGKMSPIADAIDAPAREPKPERFKLCATCGQTYDTHHMGEAFHHA